MGWSDRVSTNDAHARASGRRGYNRRRQEAAKTRRLEVARLAIRWGTSTAARVKMATVLKVSVTTIGRDLRSVQETPPLPMICPTCGLPSRLDLDASSLTDDPDQVQRLERAFGRLLGVSVTPKAAPARRSRRAVGARSVGGKGVEARGAALVPQRPMGVPEGTGKEARWGSSAR